MYERRTILSVVAGVGLAGCSTGPDDETPPTTVNETTEREETPTKIPTDTESRNEETTPSETESPRDTGFPYPLETTNYHDEAVELRINVSWKGSTETRTSATPVFDASVSLKPNESVSFEDVFDCPSETCTYVVSYAIVPEGTGDDEHTGDETLEVRGGSRGYVSFEIRSPSDVSVRMTLA